MQIFFQTKKIEIHKEEKDFIAHRIEGLRKFFSPHAHSYIDIERTTAHNNAKELYYVSIRINDGEHKYFSEGHEGDIRTAFDDAYSDIYRIIRNDRSKSRSILKSAGRKFKNFIRRINK